MALERWLPAISTLSNNFPPVFDNSAKSSDNLGVGHVSTDLHTIALHAGASRSPRAKSFANIAVFSLPNYHASTHEHRFATLEL